MKFFKEVAEEKRKIRWSNTNKSTRVFISTIFTILIFVIVISLFSWGVASLIELAA